DGLKYGLAAGLSQPAKTGLPAETVAGLLDQPAGYGLSAELTAGLFLLAAGSDPPAVTDAGQGYK
ncbi:hypothetical protein Tco_1139141, partial [Tanacetum coccineum]